MKKTAYRFRSLITASIFIITSITIFMSCEDDEKNQRPNPSIQMIETLNYVSSDTTVSVGQTFIVKVHAEYNGYDKLTNFIAKLNGENYLDLGLYAESYDREVEIQKGLDDIEEWEFIIRDFEGNFASTSITITKDPNVVYGEIDEFLNVQLGAQNSTEYGSFFSFSNGNTYNLQEAYNNQEIINMAYVYDNYDSFEESVITSPGGNIDDAFTGEFGLANWETRNTIRYSRAKIDVSVNEFDSAVNDSILLVNTFGYESGGRKTKLLNPDDIYSFVCFDNRKGIFKVVSTSGTNSGSIVVDIKIQN
ncbi:MAG: hypothetical protein JEY96_11365 [Bacteroidales bacterium]|nr:hypothetical protein [Bacteroidales bacterium]